MKKFVLATAALVTALPVWGQQGAGEQEVTEAQLAIVALGPLPQRKYRMPKRDEAKEMERAMKDVMEEMEKQAKERGEKFDKDLAPGSSAKPILLENHPDETPPNSVYIKRRENADAHGSSEGWRSIRVAYNNAAAFKKVPAGKALSFFRRDDMKARDNMEHYAKFQGGLQPGSRTMMFLQPTGTGRRPWKGEPKITLLNLDSETMAEKDLVVRNFSSAPVATMIGKKKVLLNPGEFRSYDFNAAEGKLHRFVAVEGRKKIVYTNIKVDSGSVTVIAFYNANPKTNSGFKTGVFRTSLPMPPKPEPAEQP